VLRGKAGLVGAALIAFCVQSLSAQTLQKAEDLYKRTDYEGSLALVDKHNEDAAANFLRGRDYFMLGDFKKASDYLQKAAAGDPRNSEYMDWLGRAFGKRAETGNPLMAPSYASKARQAFEKSVALNGKNAEALSDLFDYYLEAPGFLGGGFDKASQVARQIAAVDPAEGYFAKAQLAQKSQQFQAAEQHLREAAALAPHQVGRLIDLAKFLAKEGRTQESDQVFLQAQKLYPDAPRVWFARADTLIRQKRNLDEAKSLLQKYMHANITADDPPRQEAARLLKATEGA
jgi:tetratricopeptide (TPR) repeat protein